jgi:CheY-like chemotaxis protein
VALRKPSSFIITEKAGPIAMSAIDLAPAPGETHLLVVDDNPADRELLFERLTGVGYHTAVACDGQEAWAMLDGQAAQHVDVVLLDRVMPAMSGMQLLSKIKGHPDLKLLPVILQTGVAERDQILEGIRAGAYYYLTKPYDLEMLVSIVRAAAADYFQVKKLQSTVKKALTSLSVLRHAVFSLRTLDEAYDLGTSLAKACPDPETAVLGLTELIVNAVEHGNLGISYEEKSKLNSAGRWLEEVERRLALPENSDKRVEVLFERLADQVRFTIRDQGEGFDWAQFLDIAPQRAFDTHGRGIALANHISFSHIEYRGPGNEVVATVASEKSG